MYVYFYVSLLLYIEQWQFLTSYSFAYMNRRGLRDADIQKLLEDIPSDDNEDTDIEYEPFSLQEDVLSKVKNDISDETPMEEPLSEDAGTCILVIGKSTITSLDNIVVHGRKCRGGTFHHGKKLLNEDGGSEQHQFLQLINLSEVRILHHNAQRPCLKLLIDHA